MKIRSGFVSNSSSSSFVVVTGTYPWQPTLPTEPGNPQEALDWLKSHSTKFDIFVSGDKVDMRWENNQVVQYEGCCDRCYGPTHEWTEDAFLKEFKYSKFTFSKE